MKISARNQLSGTVESVNTDTVMTEALVKSTEVMLGVED